MGIALLALCFCALSLVLALFVGILCLVFGYRDNRITIAKAYEDLHFVVHSFVIFCGFAYLCSLNQKVR